MSCRGLRQWAAVMRMRGLNTSAEQNPALSPPRMSTIATRSAKRPVGRGADERARASKRRGERGQDRQQSKSRTNTRRHGRASCAGTREASITALISPASGPAGPARLFAALSGAFSSIHIAFSRPCENCLAAFRYRGFVVMAALAWVCRAAAWSAVMACATANGRRGGPARRPAQADLPQRRRDARRSQVPSPARTFRRAQIRRRPAQGRGAVGQALPQWGRIHLRDHAPSSGRPPRACRGGGRHRQSDRPARRGSRTNRTSRRR